MKKLISLVLFAVIPFTSAGAVDWKKYDGQEVNMICMTITWCMALQDQLGKFKEKTGITVNLDLFEESAAHQKDVAAPSSDGQAIVGHHFKTARFQRHAFRNRHVDDLVVL